MAIPKAIVKIIAVLIFKSTPQKPMIPLITNKGIKFGIILITIMRTDLYKKPMIKATNTISKDKPSTRLTDK